MNNQLNERVRFHRRDLLETRRALRKNQTEAEGRLWEYLRNSQLGKPIKRQINIHRFIVDFYCHAAKLVIEVDGDYHLTPEMVVKDKERDTMLRALGYTILRFTNEAVLEDLMTVLDTVQNHLNK